MCPLMRRFPLTWICLASTLNLSGKYRSFFLNFTVLDGFQNVHVNFPTNWSNCALVGRMTLHGKLNCIGYCVLTKRPILFLSHQHCKHTNIYIYIYIVKGMLICVANLCRSHDPYKVFGWHGPSTLSRETTLPIRSLQGRILQGNQWNSRRYSNTDQENE